MAFSTSVLGDPVQGTGGTGERGELAGELGGMQLGPAAVAQLVRRIRSAEYERFADQQSACGYCAPDPDARERHHH